MMRPDLTVQEREDLRRLRCLEAEAHALEIQLLSIAMDVLGGVADRPLERAEIKGRLDRLAELVDAVPLTPLDRAYCGETNIDAAELVGAPSASRRGRAKRVLDVAPDGTFLFVDRTRSNPARARSLN